MWQPGRFSNNQSRIRPSPASVAHRQLSLRRNLRKGEPERLLQKVRIVTEPVPSPRLVHNLARDFSAKPMEHPSLFRQRNLAVGMVELGPEHGKFARLRFTQSLDETFAFDSRSP